MALRGVCASWRAAVGKDAYVRSMPTVPLLMVVEKEDSDDREFYSLSKGKMSMILSLPEAKGKKCIECRYGWLVAIGESGELNLLNPFTRAQIDLPQTAAVDYYKPDPRIFPIQRAVLSASPSGTSDFTLMVLHNFNFYMFLWSCGDKS